MAGPPVTQIATRLEFVTVDELEAGFAERVAADALFLPRALLGAAADDVAVGALVLVSLAMAGGETALSFEGVVAWAYPPAPRTPPGREPGAGIQMHRLLDDHTRTRLERMRRRTGAGSRARMPGTRLPPLRVSFRPVPAPTNDGSNASNAEIVVAHPPAPQPRVMGLLVDQSFDPTPKPSALPLPLPAHEAEAMPSALMAPPIERPIDRSIDRSIDLRPPARPALLEGFLDGFPDALPAAPAAFEAKRTDVDLLASLADDRPAAEARQRAERSASQRTVIASMPTPEDSFTAVAAPAAEADEDLAATEHRAFGAIDDLPSADGDIELLADGEDIVAGTDDAEPRGPEALSFEAAAEFQVGERTAVMPIANANGTTGDWEGRTVLGPTGSTAEGSAASERSELPPRPLPPPEAFPPPPALDESPMGVVFVVSARRGDGDQMLALERWRWPKHGTKRWNAIDVAREEGEDIETALSASAWLAPDPSASEIPFELAPPVSSDTAFEATFTDPSVHVADLVDKAVALAAEDDESVFSTPADDEPAHNVLHPPASTPPRPASSAASADEASAAARGPPLPADDDDAETQRDLQRPPTQATPEGNARLGVLRRLLGKR